MAYVTNFFNYAASCGMVNINHSLSPLASRINEFSKGFFSDLSFRIPKNLMDSFRRSSDFYSRFPHLRPSCNYPFITKFAKPIHPAYEFTFPTPKNQTDSYSRPLQIRPGFYNFLPIPNIKFTKPIYPPYPFTSKINRLIKDFFSNFFRFLNI